MARTRKTEPNVTLSATPARRKIATAAQKQTAGSSKPHSPAAVVATQAAIVESVEVPYSPTQEQIAELAYSYWVSRGYEGGSPEEDWLRAESALLS